MGHRNFSLFIPKGMIIFCGEFPARWSGGQVAKINKKQTHETKYMVYNSSGDNVCRL